MLTAQRQLILHLSLQYIFQEALRIITLTSSIQTSHKSLENSIEMRREGKKEKENLLLDVK